MKHIIWDIELSTNLRKDMNDLKARFYKHLYVGDSQISGKGLFTDEIIKSGEIILSFGGVFASMSDRLSGMYLKSSFVGIAENTLLCELKDSQLDLSDYINHSCSPNICFDDCITMIAICDINQGEELLCDYSFWEADEKWKLKTECNCGSKNCRGIISGSDWRRITSKSKYYKYYSPFLKRRILKNEKQS